MRQSTCRMPTALVRVCTFLMGQLVSLHGDYESVESTISSAMA